MSVYVWIESINFVDAFYFSVTMMFQVSFGDVLPKNTGGGSRFLIGIMLAFSWILHTILVSGIANFFIRYELAQQLKEKLAEGRSARVSQMNLATLSELRKEIDKELSWRNDRMFGK